MCQTFKFKKSKQAIECVYSSMKFSKMVQYFQDRQFVCTWKNTGIPQANIAMKYMSKNVPEKWRILSYSLKQSFHQPPPFL